MEGVGLILVVVLVVAWAKVVAVTLAWGAVVAVVLIVVPCLFAAT